MLTERQIEQRRNAGLALKASKPEGYYVEMGKKGGRPTYMEAIRRANAQAQRKPYRPGRPRKEDASLAPGPAK